MMSPGEWLMPPTEREQLERRQEEHRRGAEAYRLRGHIALAAKRKRARAARKQGRR